MQCLKRLLHRTKLLMGLEPMTSSLPRKCSTTELQQHITDQSRRAGEGNRTLVFSLEGCCSTIELHPHFSYPEAKQSVDRMTPLASTPPTPNSISAGEAYARSAVDFECWHQKVESPKVDDVKCWRHQILAKTWREPNSGRCRIRTYVGIANGFTVRPL